MVASEDPRLVAATAEARRRLPEFIAAITRGGGPSLVKGPFTDGAHTESMWVEATDVEGERIVGTLANEPFRVRGLQRHAVVRVEFAEVSDWAYPGEKEMMSLIVRGAISREE